MTRRSNLASMSVEALLKMRDDITKALSSHTAQLQRQLASLGVGSGKRRGRPPGSKSKLAGQKVPPKYRGPNGETWSGRGLKPRWLVAEIKKGKKQESFAIKRT